MIRRFPALWLLLASVAIAHEVPDDVSIRIFVKPEANRLRFIVRVPVNALIDTQLPMSDGPGYLIIPESIPMLPTAARIWVSDLLVLKENGQPLDHPAVVETRMSRMSDPAFSRYEDALTHVNGANLPDNALVTWDRAALDVLLDLPVKSPRSAFTYTPRFGRLGVRVTTTLTFLPVGGGQRNFIYEGDPVPFDLDPGTAYSAARFFKTGLDYFWNENDNLLFLFCAVLLLRRISDVIPFALAFGLSQSTVLIAATYHKGPGPAMAPALSATAMALCVVFLALEAVVKGIAPSFRWLLAVVAGIFFGGGFWFFLDPVQQFGGTHRLLSTVAFNGGIETAQFLALAVSIPVTHLIFRYVLAEKIGTVMLAGLAAHIAWHRMADRAILLNRLPVQFPSFGFVDAALLAAVFMAGWFIRFNQRSTNQSA